jgi:hypothetical protein
MGIFVNRKRVEENKRLQRKYPRFTICLENRELIPDFKLSNRTACALPSPPKKSKFLNCFVFLPIIEYGFIKIFTTRL